MTIIASNLTGAATIGAANVTLASVGTLTATSGNATSIVAGTPGAINTARALVSAPAASGVGSYSQAFSLGLSVPGDSPAGAYAGTLTVTIAPPV